MSYFDHPDFDDHEHVSYFADPDSGLRAIIAIHNTVLGPAGGGCRMWDYASDEEALRDALRLSRAMTYKIALAGLPGGGGKTVIIGDATRDKSESLLLAIGRAVQRLGGRYIIAEDVGTTPEDMETIARETDFVVGRPGESGDTSPATGYGVYLGLRTAVARKLGTDALEGIRVAVQGAGNVATYLCQHLHEAGARLAIADPNEAAAGELAEKVGATIVSPERIYDEECDVFSPCALGAVLNDETIPRLRCSVVAGGANNQLAEDRHAEALAARGILYAPDYVLNAGGIINAYREAIRLSQADSPGYDESWALEQVERIAATLDEILDIADRESITPDRAAARKVETILEEARSRAKPQSATSARA
ncbi:MAG TPA: Glu/Leu/Phe/Val dehydrogenase [Deltaproteobacteria bacterium]|nr:Glu/Leu/Phe/Val dehydrogenase [Deltaproteobacteria bacterium]